MSQDIHELDAAFTLPDWLDDEGLRGLYEILVFRMRGEVAHVPMNTVQQLLLERIAFNYISLKYREGKPIGDDQGFQHAGIIKDFNTFWLNMTREFNDLLVKFRPSDDEIIARKVKDGVIEVLATLESPQQRMDLTRRFVDTFERAGIL